LLGIWKTTDGGQTWNQLPLPASLVTLWASQVWYNNAIAVSPHRPQHRVGGAGRRCSARSTAGTTWAQVSQVGPNNVQIHVDQHLFVFTNDGSKLYIGNDGGMYSQPPTRGDAGQFYESQRHTRHHAVLPGILGASFRSEHRYRRHAGQWHATLLGNLSWNNVTCGDGGNTAIDPSVPTVMYSACQNIAINVFGVPGWISANYGIDQTDRTQFISPLVIDSANPQVLYFGTFRFGAPWMAEVNGGVSPDISVNGSSTIKTIAVAPSDSNTVYAGTSNGLVRVTRKRFRSQRRIVGE